MKTNLLNFKKSTLFTLYILGFIFAFSSAIPAYINSSFLTSITNEHITGVVYSVGSILSLIILISIPKFLRKYGNYKVILAITTVYFLDFLGLALIPNVYLVLLCFVILAAMATVVYFCLDVFLEHNSSDGKTGGIRGVYLTCTNIAWFISPWLAGVIVGESSYKNIYLIVALLVLPIILIISSNLKDFKDPEYKTFNLLETIKSINANKNIKNIWMSSFLLQIFYVWMIIYTPIYLNRYIGFSWETIGIMFSIMLLPFILIEIPSGYFADNGLGERSILTIGFIIMGISTAIIPLISDNNFLIWTLILFVTRIGAAMVEVMTDTCFFKNINDRNLNTINLYRTTSPLAYIISPIVVTLLTFFIPLGNIFYILGLLMIFGLKYSLAIKDTR